MGTKAFLYVKALFYKQNPHQKGTRLFWSRIWNTTSRGEAGYAARLTLASCDIIIIIERGAAKAVSLLQVSISLALFRLKARLFYFIPQGQSRIDSLQNAGIVSGIRFFLNN